MKFISPLKKEPPFDTKLVLLHQDGSWDEGYLKGILQTPAGKFFTFKSSNEEFEYCAVKFYLIPEVPKEKVS